MKLKFLVPGSVVICALFLFTGVNVCKADEKVGMDQWTKTLKAKIVRQTNPDGFATAMKQGDALAEAQKYPEAIGAFSEAIRLNPQSSKAYTGRGDAKRSQKDFAGAMTDYQAAAGLNPRDTGLLITLANIKTDMGKHDEAIADLNKILEAAPNNLDALISRGYARKQIKDYTGAKADFQKALEISPHHPFAARMLKSIKSSGQALNHQQTQWKPFPQPLQADTAAQQVSPSPAPASLPAASAPVSSPDVSRNDSKSSSPSSPESKPPASTSDGVLKEFDPCKPDLNISDLVWSAIETPDSTTPTPAKSNSRFNDLLVFSSTRHNHPVTTAKAQLAYLMGDISSGDQSKFDEKWSYFFQHPSEETTAYFEKLIPLLADLIEKRNQVTSAVLARDEALKDADEAQAFESTEALANASAIAGKQTEILQALEQELKSLAAEVQALGDPPNPLANACKSKKKHEDAKKIAKDTLKAAILPQKLKGKTNIAYVFKPESSGLEKNTKLYWDFGDGEAAEAPLGEVKHTFKKAGRFTITLSLMNTATQEKVPIAGSKALITGLSATGSEDSQNTNSTKFNFIAKDPFQLGKLPEGCTVVKNEGRENGPIHANESLKDHLSYTFYAVISCKEKTIAKGEASLENMVKPVPFKIYATPATVNLSVEYYPPDNIFYKGRVESMSKLLADEKEMKWLKAEPYKFGGWGANGRIIGYGSVKTPLSKSDDRRRHEVDFYGIGRERTLVGFQVKTLVGYNADTSGNQCKKNGSYCGNALENEIVGKFRDGLRDQLATTHVAYYHDLEKLVAGMRLKGLPYAQVVPEDTSEISQADEAWLNDDGTALTPEELIKRKQQALVDAEKFYLSNVDILQKNLSREQADYEREKDPDRKAAFFFRMMAIQADIQAEQDKISTLHTGKIVHTRTQYDDYVQSKFIDRIKDEQEKYVKLERAAALIRKEAKKLPPEERAKAEALIDKKLNGKTLASLDEATVRQVGEAIFNKTQGYNEAEAAKYEEEAVMWDDYTTRAEKVKFWADMGMIGCSFLGGPMALSSVYDISTGYFQGGVKEAATQLALQTGAFALGKYVGAGSRAAAGADEAAMAAKTASRQSGKVAKGLSNADELKIFKANRTQGEKVVREFADLNQDLKKAYLGKASKDEIAVIKDQLRKKTIEIQANSHAKNFLKYNGDKLTQTRFTRSIKSVHSDVEKKFYEKMRRDNKWGDFEVKEMRNASSSGSVGMDYDVGLIEKPNFIKLPDGTMKPQYWLMKDGKPATRRLWQEEAQKCWNEAYQEVTLKNAERSWENITTKIHPESYQDLAVLDGNLSKVSKEWIQQTADVTRYKSMHMLKDGSMSKFEKLQEISRGTAKDINTKMMPMLGHMQKTKQVYEAAEHWKKVTSVLDDFGKNKIDPITAERRIAELTGGKSIPEVVDDMSYMMESIVKLGKK